MTFAKMDAIIRRNAEKAQRVKTNGRLQSTHYELPKQDATPEPQNIQNRLFPFPHWVYSTLTIPSMTLLKKNSEGECRARKREVVLNYKGLF